MRYLAAIALVAAIAAAGAPPVAAGTWDEFKVKKLDGTLWVGDQFGTPPPGVTALEIRREIVGGKLLMSHRAYGESGGVSTNRLVFRNDAPFTSVQFDVKINAINATDCTAPVGFSAANFGQFNFLFRTDDASLGCDVTHCDVFAIFYVDHVTANGPNIAQVHAVVEARPIDGSPGTILGAGIQEFGTVKKGAAMTVKTTWDAANTKVVFDVTAKKVTTTKEVVYGNLNATGVGGPLNTIEMSEFVCGPGGVAESSASFDKILVTP